MKTSILIAVIAATVTFMSCTKDETNVVNAGESRLDIQTSFGDFQTRATISAFPNQSELGLFVTNGSIGGNYNNLPSNANVRSIYNMSSRSWVLDPQVYLSSANATIFAYFPYSSANNDATAIPIEHTTQTDYLYGTHASGQSLVNNGNPVVNLTMRHALTLLQFKINRSNYTGNGIITRIEIGNATGKTSIYSAGKLNIATGTISKTAGQNSNAFIQNSSGLYTIPLSQSNVESPNLRLMLLPVSATSADGDVKMYFTIDGKIYTYNVPASTAWNMGTKNVYTITLSGTGLVVGNVSITDWVSGVTGNATLR